MKYVVDWISILRKSISMLARKQINTDTAKVILKERGWSYRAAAPLLGVHYTHLCLVLNGQRQSRSLLHRIQAISINGESK